MTSHATSLRVSDAEREPTIDRLKTAYADGQIDHDELELRVQLAMTARTQADLGPLVADLDRRPTVPGVVWPEQEITLADRTWAGVAHATGLVPILLFPALIMGTVGRESAYVRHHAAQALNLQLTVLGVTVLTFGIGALAYTVLWAVALAGGAMAFLGSGFRYPLTLQLFGRDVARTVAGPVTGTSAPTR